MGKIFKAIAFLSILLFTIPSIAQNVAANNDGSSAPVTAMLEVKSRHAALEKQINK